jgi:succinate dehydrogenase / fumarate reductase iron-sulfur subunit
MACIQCGACVSDCLSLEVDPLFVGPAALAKAYRFAGDPRDGAQYERVKDLAEDPHGMYECTHCFMCVDACPKGVAPMNQIMRLRRVANARHGIVDRNNGHRHERAFAENVRRNGLINEGDLLADSYGGKLHPRFIPQVVESLPAIARAVVRRKIGREAIGHPHRKVLGAEMGRLYDRVRSRPEPFELNLYVSGHEDA